MDMDDGYIMLARKIQVSGIWAKPGDWLKVWIHILQEVNHSKNKLFDRGENLFNYKNISKECGVSYDTVNNFKRWAVKTSLFVTRKTTRGVVIKVLKYDQYQNPKSYKNHTKNQIGTKQEPNRNHTIREECNNNKNDKKEVEASINKKLVFERFPYLTEKEYENYLIEVKAWYEQKRKGKPIITNTMLNWIKKDPPIKKLVKTYL